MNQTSRKQTRQPSFRGIQMQQDLKSSNKSSSLSENIEDEDEEFQQQYCPKKPNQEFSNSKIITAAASTYIAQELQNQYFTNSQNGFSPDQIEKQSKSKQPFNNMLNDTGALIRDFDISSIDNRVNIPQAALTTKQKQKAQSRFMNISLLKSSSKNLNEDRPLQMTSSKPIVGRSTVQSKRVSSNHLKLGSGTFDSINPNAYQNHHQNVSSTKNILKSGLMSTTHQQTAKNIHKLKRVRSQTSAKEQYDLDRHNNSCMLLNLADQSGLNTSGVQQNLQFEFGVHKPSKVNKLSLGIAPYYSPHNQSTTCFMTTAQRTMKHQHSSDSYNFNLHFNNNNLNNSNIHPNNTLSNLNFLQQQQHMYQLQQQRLMNNSSSMNFMPNTFQEQHESIDNIYTLKKVQSKVRDKIVPWIDLQSTSATMNNNNYNQINSSNHNNNQNGSLPRQTEDSTAFSHLNKVSLGAINTMDINNYQNSTMKLQNNQNELASQPIQTESGVGILKHAKFSNLAFKQSNQDTDIKKQYGSPPDKMSIYNFTQVNHLTDKNKKQQQRLSQQHKDDKDFFNEESLCITEENRFQNEINPIKLADLEWGDQYKLDKLMRQQARLIDEGWFDPNTYFGYDDLIIEQAFQWFDIAKRDLEVYMMKRKSSAGLVQQNTFVNQSINDFGSTNFKLQTSGTMLGFGNNQRGVSIIMGGGEIQDQANLMQTESSSDDEGGDEVEKFRNTFLKNKSGSKFLFMKGKRNNQNLLIKEQEQYDDEDMSQQQDNEDFNNMTPKVLSSNENSDEDEKEDRPMQMRTNFKVLEELVEESREESLRADSNMHFHIPLQYDQQQYQSNKQQLLEQIKLDELEELQEDSKTDVNIPQTNRMYDSDIFVMSNTTFDEDLASISSRRVSLGKQPYRNEFLSFVDNSQDLSVLQNQNLANQSQLDGITNKLFFHQQNQQLLQRRQQRYQQNLKVNEGGLSTKNNIAMKNQHVKQKQQKIVKNKDKPLTSSIQTLLSQNNQTHVSTNINSVMHDKKQSLTKFSNYVSSSNNLSPVPQHYQHQQSSFFNYKQNQQNNNSNNNMRYNKSHYNSMSSINMQLYKQQPTTMNSHVFQINSGHFSILSGNSNNQTMQQNQQQQQPTSNTNQVCKSHSNENFSKQVIAISSTLNQNMQKMTHHSPQCSLSMGPNLSPGPGYKMKERNSLFQKEKFTRNKNSLGITQQLSDSDLSQKKIIMLSGRQQLTGNGSVKRITNQSVQNLHKLGTQRFTSDQKQSLINNSTTIDSSKHQKQNMTLGSAELKQQLNVAKLRKQRSDNKMDTQSSLLFEASNSMVTQKLLASIKQNMINKKLQQEAIQTQSIINDDTYNQPLYALNRQRSKSEIETIYEIGNKHQQLMQNKSKPSNQRANQTIAPLSPSKSLKSVGFPYNNGKTMSDINKFFEERSEHNISLQSAINKQNAQKSTSKLSNDINLQYISNENPINAYDMISNGSGSNIFNKNQTTSLSGQGILKEPSFIPQQIHSEIHTNESCNSPQIKIFKNGSTQQSFKLNFGIQPHLVKKYQSPTAALSQSYQLSSFNQMSLSKRNESSHILNNSSILQPSINKTKSIPQQQKIVENKKTQNPQVSIIKQRIAKSPNKKSMMILNSSLGSNSNNISMVAAAIGYNNQDTSTKNSKSQFNYNSNALYQKQQSNHAHHDSNSSDVVKVLEYSDQKPRQ